MQELTRTPKENKQKTTHTRLAHIQTTPHTAACQKRSAILLQTIRVSNFQTTACNGRAEGKEEATHHKYEPARSQPYHLRVSGRMAGCQARTKPRHTHEHTKCPQSTAARRSPSDTHKLMGETSSVTGGSPPAMRSKVLMPWLQFTEELLSPARTILFCASGSDGLVLPRPPIGCWSASTFIPAMHLHSLGSFHSGLPLPFGCCFVKSRKRRRHSEDVLFVTRMQTGAVCATIPSLQQTVCCCCPTLVLSLFPHHPVCVLPVCLHVSFFRFPVPSCLHITDVYVVFSVYHTSIDRVLRLTMLSSSHCLVHCHTHLSCFFPIHLTAS